ncbi:MAG: tRNA (guanosine(37)-N1)-methyltransferase TrmD [Actinomycetota bacterium]|nr:tRNA (guanosine(37)-N1)-methyltransferase TrmD [Actinomycetota bacterium]
MKIDIITIFPKMFASPFAEGMIRVAQEKGLVEIGVHDLRDFTHNKHRQVDDLPYGGGAGMVMKPEPFFEAVEKVAGRGFEEVRKIARVILFTPQGHTLNQRLVEEFSQEKHLILLCGRYEGVDERVREHLATDEISVGDYVLSGGELPAMVLVDAVTRLIHGVLGAEESLAEETFTRGLLEYPQYTRPTRYRGWSVPKVLLGGNHAEIAKWRRRASLERTLLKRPDLLQETALSEKEKKALKELKRHQ